MVAPLPIPRLLDEWLLWARWATDPNRQECDGNNLIGFDEFDWIVRDLPEYAWEAILTAINDPRLEPYLGNLAAGPVEDLLSRHGEAFISRVEAEAKCNPKFAWMLGGVNQLFTPDHIWARVEAVADRSGWHD